MVSIRRGPRHLTCQRSARLDGQVRQPECANECILILTKTETVVFELFPYISVCKMIVKWMFECRVVPGCVCVCEWHMQWCALNGRGILFECWWMAKGSLRHKVNYNNNNQEEWEAAAAVLGEQMHRIHFHYGMRACSEVSISFFFSFLSVMDEEGCGVGGGEHEIDATHNATDKTNARGNGKQKIFMGKRWKA